MWEATQSLRSRTKCALFLPGRNFFWPGLKILRAGGLASSAGSLFQCFTSLTDKKVFLVCNSLHGWNRQPETAWEDGFSNTSWAFVQTGFEVRDIWNGWITQSKSKVNWFLLVLSLFYVPSKSTFPSWSVWQTLHIVRLWERAHGIRAPSSLYPLPITCNMCPMKNIPPRHWNGPQGIISFSISLCFSEQGFGLVGFCHFHKFN